MSLLFNRAETATQLARLVVEHSHVERWLFKLDGEVNSRGIAYFDVYSDKRLTAAVKRYAEAADNEKTASVNTGDATQRTDGLLVTRGDAETSKETERIAPKTTSLLFAEVQREINRLLPKKLQFAKRGIYKDYFHFIEEFCRRGGIIEASPSIISKNVSTVGVLFQLEPDGEVEIQTTYEKIQVSLFNSCGFKFPQSALPNLNVTSVD